MDSESSFNSKQKRLILHFDINKTLVLADTRKKLPKEEALNFLLSKFAWGRIEQQKEPLWKLAHTHFISEKPAEDMISYNSYVFSIYPEKTIEEEPNEEARIALNEQLRSSSPGMKLKPEYDRLVKNISLPQSVYEDIKLQSGKLKQEPQTNGIKNQGFRSNSEFLFPQPSKYLQLFSDGKYQILPGFFRMVMQLQKLKRDFSIVFHSFTENLYDIISEFNIGEHPCFNGKNNTAGARLDGQKGTKNCVIQERNIGTVYRYSEDMSETVLVTGTLKRVKKIKQLEDEYEKELEEDSVQLHKGYQSMYTYIGTLSQDKTLVINHDYEFWESNGKKSPFAKPLLIDQQDFDILNIFFDDDISQSDDSILDIRDAVTGQPIAFKKAINKYMVQISLIDIIRDPDYLIKQIDICEKNRDEEIERIKNGISEDEVPKPKQSLFELLQECPKAEYLKKTILPLLYPAFQLVDKERPIDPISFIALYCLKQKGMVNVPAPDEEYLKKHNEKYASLLKEVVPI